MARSAGVRYAFHMASSISIFHRASLVNLGTLLGVAVGLSVGMLGAAALYPNQASAPATVAGLANPPRTTLSLALERFRLTSAQESLLLADALRTIRSGRDAQPARQALATQHTITTAAFRDLYGSVLAAQYQRAHTSIADKLIAYANKLRIKADNPASALNGIDTDIGDVAKVLSQAEKGFVSSIALQALSRERDANRALIQAADTNKISETYTRQQQALDAQTAWINLLGHST